MADNATRATVRAKSVNAAGILDATDLVTVDALALAPVLVTANVAEFVGRDDDMLD